MESHRTVIDEATATLDGVDVALVRLSDGTYRECEVCAAAPLPDLRLASDPTLRRCAEHVGAP